MAKNNKKGIELSMSFIVAIIIAIAIFGFGIRFIYNLADKTNDIKDFTSGELDNKIAELSCEAGSRVCLGIERRVIPRGNLGVFGLKIINIQNETNFDITVSRPAPLGYTKDNKNITEDNLDWAPKQRSVMLERNEEKQIGIGISVPKDAGPGVYIFDVKVEPYSILNKIYVEVP